MGEGSFSLACDVLVVGGGVNGTGIARDLAGRGWRVVLVEQDDLASHTSSASTKLIHGGLRYLEYYEFSLVRKALQEREILLKSAPHIMRPLRFVMPHDPSMRPAWLIRLGLFLYDHLARREVLPGSQGIDLRTHPAGAPLKAGFTRGFAYSDGWVDDARLVVLNAIDAREHGAQILTRTRCTAAERHRDGWTATLQTTGDRATTLHARALVNATGPWAESFLQQHARPEHGEALTAQRLRLVKGSHIVVPRCFEHDHAYVFQNPDRRLLFALPYEGAFTLIGTTDQVLHGDPGQAGIDDGEVDYLCTQASRCFARPITPADVVWRYSGVRPLLDDDAGNPSAVSRDYLLESNTGAAPLLNVWSGKLTTFRRLAEHAADEIGRLLGEHRPAWTRGCTLPGGDFSAWIGAARQPDTDFERLLVAVLQHHPWLPTTLARRLTRAYGSRIGALLAGVVDLAGLGAEIAPGLHEAELRFLQTTEWATCGDDVLWRRSKLGLHFTPAERQRVQEFFGSSTG